MKDDSAATSPLFNAVPNRRTHRGTRRPGVSVLAAPSAGIKKKSSAPGSLRPGFSAWEVEGGSWAGTATATAPWKRRTALLAARALPRREAGLLGFLFGDEDKKPPALSSGGPPGAPGPFTVHATAGGAAGGKGDAGGNRTSRAGCVGRRFSYGGAVMGRPRRCSFPSAPPAPRAPRKSEGYGRLSATPTRAAPRRS